MSSEGQYFYNNKFAKIDENNNKILFQSVSVCERESEVSWGG